MRIAKSLIVHLLALGEGGEVRAADGLANRVERGAGAVERGDGEAHAVEGDAVARPRAVGQRPEVHREAPGGAALERDDAAHSLDDAREHTRASFAVTPPILARAMRLVK